MQKNELHPRNRHRSRYDFKRLCEVLPELSAFVVNNPYGDASIDFANPAAVKTLNRALLKDFYRVDAWDIPAGYLCPPIPGRADLLHHVADLLAGSNDGKIPRGPAVRVLDVGTGANCVYPLIGHREYGWSFTGTEIDEKALASARKILDANPDLRPAIDLHLQKNPPEIFSGVVAPSDFYDLVICNPPFHASPEDAQAGSRRKWKNLGKAASEGAPVLNFGGTGGELWCEGGERAFIRRMIDESSSLRTQCLWFSALVSREEHLDGIENRLIRAKVASRELLVMAQGQKKSRVVAWTFQTPEEHALWKKRRFRAV